MVASCHPLLTFPGAVLLWGTFWYHPTAAQVGLRTLPLTAPRNRTSLGLFSKWTGSKIHLRPNSTSIENELAAIFRGVAYGVSTESTTSSTTTTTTTTTTVPPYFSRSPFLISGDVPPSSVPVSPPPWNKDSDGARPVQHPHVEPPISNKDYALPDDPETSLRDDMNVLRSDVGISKMAWISILGASWDVHVYTVAGLFTLLALCSLYFLARLHVTSQLLPRGYYITIHLLVFLASFFRCVLFFHDPYAVEERLPPGLSNVLFNTGIPCIITALAVLILALLKAVRMRILPLNLQSPLAVGIVSGILIAGSVVVDVLGSFIENHQLASGLRAGMQALTAGWGAALCLGYMVIFYKIEKTSKRQQSESTRLSFTRVHLEGSLQRRFARTALSCGARATLVAAISGLLLAVLQVYGLMNTDGILIVPPQQPWVWFAYHTSCRSLEVIMWACICFASALPASLSFSKRKQTGGDEGQLLTVFACKSCTSCSNISTCCTTAEKKNSEDLYSTICQSSHVVRKFSFQEGRKPILQDTIATARPSPSHISTTIVPSKSKTMTGKSATLRADPSDAQPLWSNYNFNTSSTSRPSSLILSENGAIRFRTVDPRHESVQVIDYKNIRAEPKVNSCDKSNMNMFVGDVCEDNYINGSCCTPSDVCEGKSFTSDKYPHSQNNQESPELYAEIVQNQYYNNDLPTSNKMVGMIPSSRAICKSSNSSHVYSGYEVPNYYQSSDIPAESSPHIYASLQPIERESFNDDLNIRRGASQGKFYNNPHFRMAPTGSPWRQAPTVLSDDQRSGHHQYNTAEEKRCQQFCSDSDLCSNDYMFNHPEDMSSSRSVGFHPCPTNDLNSPRSVQNFQLSQMREEAMRSFRPCHEEAEDGAVDLIKGTSPHPSKGLFSKIVPSNFNNGGYSPLSSEESASLLNENAKNVEVHSQNRLPGHRPKRSKQSPTPVSPRKLKESDPLSVPAKDRRDRPELLDHNLRGLHKKSNEPPNSLGDGKQMLPSNPFLHQNPDAAGHARRHESADLRTEGSPLPSSVVDSDLDASTAPDSEEDDPRRSVKHEAGWSEKNADF